MLYFFLSHASGDDDSYVARFFQDLAAEVERLVGVDAELEVGAIAADPLDVGTRSSAANDAVATCRVFVALCSPRYFLSERCGREWSLFADRLRRYEQATSEQPGVLIPIVWARVDPPASVPDVRERLHMGPKTSTREEVSQLIRLRSRRGSYVDFVRSLAGRIVAAATTHDIPPPGPGVNLRSVSNAFEYWDQFESTRVHFVVAAGTRAEMIAVRRNVSFYGDDRLDWAPYRPALSEPLAVHAREIAAEQLFGSDVFDIDQFDDRLAPARGTNEIVVLLVDAWVTALEAYRQALADLDIAGGSVVAVLVPSSDDDVETVQRRERLTAGVRDVLGKEAGQHDPLFRTDIRTHQSFDTDLVAALERAQNRIFRFGHVFRPPPSDEPTKRPLLKGP